MHRIIFFLIKCYRLVIRPYLGPRCRFYPSCSYYGEMAISQFGVFKGMLLLIKRLLRCHPFNSGGYDPLPSKKKKDICK